MILEAIDVTSVLKDFGGWGFFGITVWIGGRALLSVLHDGFQFLGGKLEDVGKRVEDVGEKVDELRACVTRQGDRLERLEERVGVGDSIHKRAQ